MDEGISYFDAVEDFNSLPKMVVIDVSKQIRMINALFSASPEFIIDQIVEACSYKPTAHRDIANMTRYLHLHLSQAEEELKLLGQENGVGQNPWPYPSVTLFDKMITIEQSALDIFHQFDLFKLYVMSGFLPYRYEHTFGDGSLILKKYDDCEEFFDRVAHLSCYQV